MRIYGRSSRRARATNPAARAVRRVARTRTQGVRLCARPHAPSAGACVALVGARFVRLFVRRKHAITTLVTPAVDVAFERYRTICRDIRMVVHAIVV